jgi:hypothetical protein
MQGISKNPQAGLVMRQDTAGGLWLPKGLSEPLQAKLAGRYVKQADQVNGKAWYEHDDDETSMLVQ